MEGNRSYKEQLLSSIQDAARFSLLDLRGHYVLSLDTREQQATDLALSHHAARVFPLTETEALILFARYVALVNARSKEVYWTLLCPHFSVALTFDLPQKLLVLWEPEPKQLVLWDLQTGASLCTLDIGDSPTDLAFIPQSALLVVAGGNPGVQLWCWSSGGSALLHRLKPEEEDYFAQKSVTISPDGQYIATGNYECATVWLWQSEDGQLLRRLEPPTEKVWMPHFNSATNQWKRVWEYPLLDRRVHGLAFSPDGHLLVSGEVGGAWYTKGLPVWDMTTGQAAQTFPQKAHHPVFSPDGRHLAAQGWLDQERGTYAIYLWDVTTRQVLRMISAERGHESGQVAFTPSGRMLISSDKDGRIRWWDIQSGQEIYCIEIAQIFS